MSQTDTLVATKTATRHLISEAAKTAYVADLEKYSYSPRTITQYLSVLERFDRWAIVHDVAQLAISKALVQRFLATLDSPAMHSHRAALHRFLRLVDEQQDSTAVAIKKSMCHEPDRAMQQYHRYLSDVRGLAANTCHQRLRLVRFSLQALGTELSTWSPSTLVDFFTHYGKAHKPGSTQCLATAVRSYLRFEQLQGGAVSQLIAAIPTVANWPHTTLPNTLSDDELNRLFSTFDRTTTVGRRDYAIARCLIDLGLRASEVAYLRLDDIHWREGRLTLPAVKARRTDILPLPVSTGIALAAYLQDGRPATASRFVFLRHKAPHGVPTTPEIVRGAMRRAYARAGFPAEWTGTHRLRHTAATRMLRQGTPLKAIADVLRHESLDTTTHYTRVDLVQLRAVAMPWPETVS